MVGRMVVAHATRVRFPSISPNFMNKDNMNTDNYVVIADIHGRYDLLIQLLEMISKREDLKGYRKVFLGDMVDRGKESFQVVDTVKKLTETEDAIALLGNHEDMMITYAKRGVYNKQDIWLYNGGGKTMDSYEKSMKMYGHGHFFRAFGNSGHLRWMAGLLPYYETEKVWFSHAPIPAKKYREAGAEDFRRHLNTLIWSWHGHWAVEEDVFLEDLGKTAVYGHVHRLLDDGNTNARVHKNGIYIDAGCGCAFNAPLIAAVITNGKYQEAIYSRPLIVETRTLSDEDKRPIWAQA